MQVAWTEKLFGPNVPYNVVCSFYALANSESRLSAANDQYLIQSEELEYNLRRIASSLRDCGVEGVN